MRSGWLFAAFILFPFAYSMFLFLSLALSILFDYFTITHHHVCTAAKLTLALDSLKLSIQKWNSNESDKENRLGNNNNKIASIIIDILINSKKGKIV